MAEIQIVCSEGYCDFDFMGTEYNTQCHTQCAADRGCEFFSEGEHSPNVIPFGNCIHAKLHYIYKGLSVKNYELAELNDPYNPHLSCMTLKTRNVTYYCDKVTLDGTCIYDNLPSE